MDHYHHHLLVSRNNHDSSKANEVINLYICIVDVKTRFNSVIICWISILKIEYEIVPIFRSFSLSQLLKSPLGSHNIYMTSDRQNELTGSTPQKLPRVRRNGQSASESVAGMTCHDVPDSLL